MNNSFPKSEKLCGQVRISEFYRQSKRFVQWPLRVSYRPVEGDTRILIWAPKSLFKHAVDRNRLRRLMREAYRLHADEIRSSAQHYEIAFNYMDKTEQPYATIEKAVRKSLKKIHETSAA